ncbi:hypothetical protein JAAARDRAFT_37830 [Jaapia argillacea MUCL 33604]|uniref:Uncharacterized protein n=1 Tax=Jaapia argillacea MUCL 33604 TaxID=933084 RepID=A0A067PTX0_9AGAM|nr:hypothetical protein JAAARDRAFT_37830 [Jaapia argillacea MUCL 33604]
MHSRTGSSSHHHEQSLPLGGRPQLHVHLPIAPRVPVPIPGSDASSSSHGGSRPRARSVKRSLTSAGNAPPSSLPTQHGHQSHHAHSLPSHHTATRSKPRPLPYLPSSSSASPPEAHTPLSTQTHSVNCPPTRALPARPSADAPRSLEKPPRRSVSLPSHQNPSPPALNLQMTFAESDEMSPSTPTPLSFLPTPAPAPAPPRNDFRKKSCPKLREYLITGSHPHDTDSIHASSHNHSRSCASSESGDSETSSDIMSDDYASEESSSKEPANRFSRKWVREKGGHRWVEDDYRGVLDALRKLR